MTKGQALLVCVAASEARTTLSAAIEEADVLRGQAVHSAADAIERSVLRPDDREAARAARRALGAVARATAASLELRALAKHQQREIETLAREYRLRLEEIEITREQRAAYAASKRSPEPEAESGSGGYTEASPAAPTSPASEPRRRALAEA